MSTLSGLPFTLTNSSIRMINNTVGSDWCRCGTGAAADMQEDDNAH